MHSDYDAVSAERDGLIAERDALVSERGDLRDKLTEYEETFKAFVAERDALIADRDNLGRKITEYGETGRIHDCQSSLSDTPFPRATFCQNSSLTTARSFAAVADRNVD